MRYGYPDRKSRILLILLVTFFLTLCPASHASPPWIENAVGIGSLPLLEPGIPTEGQAKGGQSHSYGIQLGSGQFLRLTVGSPDLGAKVRLFGPGGELLLERNSAILRRESEIVTWVTQIAGVHRVEAVFSSTEELSGSYQIKLEELRDATEIDRARLAAELAEDKSQRLRAQDTKESLRQALENERIVAALWRAAGDLLEEAEAINAQGLLHSQLGERKEAVELYQQALALWREAGNTRGESMTLINLGKAYNAAGDPVKAIAELERALPLMRSDQDQFGEGFVLDALGTVYSECGEPDKALIYWQQALELRRQNKDQRGEASSLNNIATFYWQTGRLGSAVDLLRKVLELRTRIKDQRGAATTIVNLGVAKAELGELEEAADHFESALSMQRLWGDRAAQTKTLNSLGGVLRVLGDFDTALKHYEESLALARELDDPRTEAAGLHNTGVLKQHSGDPKSALESLRMALPLRRETGDRPGEAATLTMLGEVYLTAGNLQEAQAHLQQALSLWRTIRNPLREAGTLLSLARLEHTQGNLLKALPLIENALLLLEPLRANISIQEFKASFFASKREYYEFYVQLLQDLDRLDSRNGYAGLAFHASERARARNLLDTLAESETDIRRGVEPELRARQDSLQHRINLLERDRVRSLEGRASAGKVAALETELDDLLRDLDTVRAEIRSRNPRYADLTQPKPLRVEEVQALLEPGTLLLSYFLGEKRSFLWSVSRSSLTAHEIPSRNEIEAVARELHALLSQSDKRLARSATEQAASRLSEMLLGPVRKSLGKNRLVIVADGALHYIPFAALPTPGKPGSPLVVDHEVVNLPSASVLAILRHETGGLQSPSQQVAVLADPVFLANDPRVGSRSSPLSEESVVENATLQRAARNVGFDSFPRLRHTRQEAEAIASLFKPGEALKALDFNASKETATSGELARYRILHFATHGLLDTRRPDLSGLVLSLVDRQGRPLDGFLRLHEIYNLDLSADLVVLSGCETALGKEVRGEGLITLTRGFMYAGAPAVVASLWQIDDRSTGELMKRFYRGMIQEGLLAPAALRKAQLSLWKEKPTQAPYFWAGFVFQGDWLLSH